MDIEKLIDHKWYTVDQPWGDGTWAVAGGPDPHGRPVVFGIDTDDDYTIEDAAGIAAHIVGTHNQSIEPSQCVNHYCYIGGRRKGIGTNTTCECLRELPFKKRVAVQRRIQELEAEIRRLKKST